MYIYRDGETRGVAVAKVKRMIKGIGNEVSGVYL